VFVDLVGSSGGGEQMVLRRLPQIRALGAPACCQTLRAKRRCVPRELQ
jgi:hypothetical protein